MSRYIFLWIGILWFGTISGCRSRGDSGKCNPGRRHSRIRRRSKRLANTGKTGGDPSGARELPFIPDKLFETGLLYFEYGFGRGES